MIFDTLAGHRAHDVARLHKAWSGVAKRAGMKMRRIAAAGKFPVFALESRTLRIAADDVIYLSAGVHGDEPAPPWGLLAWAEENIAWLRGRPVLIFPCLNPHGITHNTRADQRGVDINRAFNSRRDPVIRAWRAAVGNVKPALSLCLHEDYDALGCYVYELTRQAGSLGAKTLQDCSPIIATETRRKIDGRAIRNGLFFRRGDFTPPNLPGLPEAIVLHALGSQRTLTFETPSEFSLLDRMAAQRRFIESALHHELGM